MVFAVATGVALVGFLLTWLLPERPLRATISAEATEGGGLVGEAFAMPVNADSLAELRRGLASLANREAQRQYMETLVREANVNLQPAAAWLLVRLEQDPAADPAVLGRAHAVSASTIDAAVDQLASRGLVTVRTMADNGSRRLAVTRAGCDVLGRIIKVRRSHLADAAAEWDTDETSVATLRDDERVLVPDARPTTD
jgi:DNA-binding MarR family transcriptional regulator